MLKELVRLANHLDSKGLVKEADYLDGIIKRSGLWDNLRGAFTGKYESNPNQESGKATAIGSPDYLDHTSSAYEEGSEVESEYHDRSSKDVDDTFKLRELLKNGPTGTPEDGRLLEMITKEINGNPVVDLDHEKVEGVIGSMSQAYSAMKKFPQVYSFIFKKDHRANTYEDNKGRVEEAAGPLRKYQY